MNRRTLLKVLSAMVPCAALQSRVAGAQDLEFIRALEATQAHRPASIAPQGRIAPEGEPGTPLIIRGRLLGEDGRSALAGAVVFAYHTDGDGLYDRRGTPAHSWRLRGWARTDPEGRFEFRSIRPAPYPSRGIPAHVHFTIFVGRERFHGGELRFDDDPLVTEAERTAARREGEFGRVRPVRQEDGAQLVEFVLRPDRAQRF